MESVTIKVEVSSIKITCSEKPCVYMFDLSLKQQLYIYDNYGMH